MNSAKLELLGGFRLSAGPNRPVEVSAKKNRALLAILAMAPRLEVTRDRLAGLLWSDRGEEQARNSLRQALVALRKDLATLEADPLVLIGDRVALDPSRLEVDVVEFILASAGNTPPELRRAADLYAGPFLDGLNVADAAFEDWLREARSDLHARATMALSRLVDHVPASEGIAIAKRLVTIDPLREASHLALMRAQSAAGQHALAINQFEACRLQLKRELGVEPGPELQELRRALDAKPRGQSVPAQDHRIPVAVLPFANMSGDATQQYISDGITEDITTELSRFGGLSVAARFASFHLAGKREARGEIAKQLGVRFVVEGSIRTSGQHIRIVAQLIDVKSGNQVWAERYDRKAGEILIVQDEIVQTVVSTLVGRLDDAERRRARGLSDAGLQAYDLYLRALSLQDSNTKESYRRSTELLEQAIDLEPEFAPALHRLSLTKFFEWLAHWVKDRDGTFVTAFDLCKRALDLDTTNSQYYAHFGLLLLSRDMHDEARSYFERAIQLNPNDWRVLALYGHFLTSTHEIDRALDFFDRALRLNPFAPDWINWCKGIAYYTARRYPDAIRCLNSVHNPVNEVRGWLAVSLGQAGKADQARALLEFFLVAANQEIVDCPERRLSAWRSYWHAAIPYTDPSDEAHLMDGLRLAGMPE